MPCLDGVDRPAIELDQAASTQAHPEAAARVDEFLPWYSSVHRGAGFRSRRATAAYEEARQSVLAFAGRAPDGADVAILCRNTTEAINHLAYRLAPDADRRGGDDGGRAPRQPAALGPGGPAPLRRVLGRTGPSPSTT